MVKNPLNPLPRLGIKLHGGGILDYVQTEDRKYVRYGYWEKGEKATIIILPGRTEYIEKYNSIIKQFLERDFSVVCIDWRGQGLSQRPKGRTDIGHVKSFYDYQIDLDTVLKVLKEKLNSKPTILFAHSMGGCIGLRSLLRGAKFDCAIFSAPLWGLPISDLTVSILIPIFNLAISLGFGFLTYPYKIDGIYILQKPFEKNILTRNENAYQEMRENLLIDPRLGLGSPTISWLVALNTELKKLAKMPPPDIPQLTLVGQADKIISIDSILARMARTPKGDLHMIPGAFHEIFYENKDVKDNLWHKVDEFLEITLEKITTDQI